MNPRRQIPRSFLCPEHPLSHPPLRATRAWPTGRRPRRESRLLSSDRRAWPAGVTSRRRESRPSSLSISLSFLPFLPPSPSAARTPPGPRSRPLPRTPRHPCPARPPRRGRLPAPALLLATLARTPRHQQHQLATAHARAHAPHPAHACVHTLAAPRRAEPCTPLRQLRSRATPQPARSFPRVHAPRPGLPVCPRARTRPRRTEPRRRPSARTAVPSHTPTAPATSAQHRLRRSPPARSVASRRHPHASSPPPPSLTPAQHHWPRSPPA